MANAKKCDRCGNYYDVTPTNLDPDIKVLMTFSDHSINQADLCKGCINKLKSFLKGAELNDNR